LIHRNAVFQREQAVTSGLDDPLDVSAADLDLDGDLDLVFAVSSGNKLVWSENTDG
jgi:hypothetical protein